MKFKRDGFSLLEMMIVGGMIAGLGLVVMQLTKTTANSQINATVSADYLGMRSELDSMLGNPFDCTASLKDTTFNGVSIKNTPVTVEIWHGNQVGVRSRKFISGTDASFNKYGKLTVGSIALTMPDYTAGVNFPVGAGQIFKGELRIEGDRLKLGVSSSFVPIVKSVNIVFDTDAAGLSKITSCTGTGGASMTKVGFVLIPTCNNNNCCVNLVFDTPFPTQLNSIVVTPEFQDYGSNSGAITSGFRNQTTAGAELCFDHVGNAITNGPFKAYWMAVGQ